MAKESELTAQHWDDYIENYSGKNTGLFWYEIPEVLRSVNRSISGDPSVDWTQHTVQKYLSDHLPVKRCLSLGSGAGQLERDLASRNVFLNCDAYDISKSAVERAQEVARQQGLDKIHYSVTDINRLHLPEETYEVVWVYGAMHHFQTLEHVSREIARALIPGGLLALNEYVGPKRFQFPDRQKEIANLCLQLLPKRYRLICAEALRLERQNAAKDVPVTARSRLLSVLRRLLARSGDKISSADDERDQVPEGQYRDSVGFPSVEQVFSADPSEAVRSDEMLNVLERDFEIIEKVEWGGNVVQFLLSGIACNFSDDDPASVELIKLLFQIEKVLMQCGEIKSDFAYVVARPRSLSV